MKAYWRGKLSAVDVVHGSRDVAFDARVLLAPHTCQMLWFLLPSKVLPSPPVTNVPSYSVASKSILSFVLSFI